MYSHCHLCDRSLGRNRAVAHMPVGRRLAYDVERGRLWVVCPRCAEWNLVPVEERWEAIEECERLYHGSTARASSANVGVAGCDGVTLVRIGAGAPRDELANERYAPRLRWRQRRAATLMAVSGGAAGAAIGGAFVAGLGVGQVKFALYCAGAVVAYGGLMVRSARERVGPALDLRVRHATRGRVRVPNESLRRAELTLRGDERLPLAVGLRIPMDGWELHHEDERALPLLAEVLPRFNWRGARPRELRAAIQIVTDAEAWAAARAGRGAREVPAWQRVAALQPESDYRLVALPSVRRLALELAVTEEVERRAMAGAADALRDRWTAAEEVAGIADDLLLPAFVSDWLARRKGVREGEGEG